MARYLPTLERLRTLAEVARTGSFSLAADRLALTQPAVSNHIRLLEQQIGVALLDRSGRTSRPTPEGEMLIAAAARAAGEIEAALDAIARQRAELVGQLVLATGATATRHLLPPVVASLRDRHPGIDLRILTGNTVDLLPGLLEGSVDIGLLTATPVQPALESRLFFRDRMVCVTPASEAPGMASITPRDLEGRQLVLFDRAGSIRGGIDGWLTEADAARLRITDIGSADALIGFVRAGYGWTIISEIVAHGDAEAGHVAIRPLDPPLWREMVLVWRADRASRPVVAAALAIFLAHATP
ncbi:LysR family transcriptional regulator [Oceanibaculum indicum]|uniref:DNA-binding transcriptional LysR family regulator n=1 Tax=Oceanibaculum indicum TaxID=526216 RepID=A0A420WI28_9PROT|nr:LysR family transcriptional regulator [Oceanibaculum indicum]RKQ70670.1 DNA-binding transcriptional LysR family regulator [Oceanibaculum indicum]